MQTKIKCTSCTLFHGAAILMVGVIIFGVSNGLQTHKTWYLDADGDGYSDGTSVLSDTQPGEDYVTEESLLVGSAYKLELKAFLGASYDSGTELMSDTRRQNAAGDPVNVTIPTTDPYLGLGYHTYAETGSQLATGILDITGDDAFVDRVLVEFRDASDVTNLKATKIAYIQRDGDIMDLDGNYIFVDANQADSYYIAVKQRNHMRVMTASPVAIGESDVLVDFTSPSTEVYGTNSQREIDGITVMRAGDVDNDDSIDTDDTTAMTTAQSTSGTFLEEDMDYDAGVDANDSTIVDDALVLFSGSTGIPLISGSESSSELTWDVFLTILNGDCDDSDAALTPTTVYYTDSDSDGYGDSETTQVSCGAVSGHVLNDTDCDDTNTNINPGETETPLNGIDEDCDGEELCYEDSDEDGFGTSSTISSNDVTCTENGVSFRNTDCDDSDAEEYPRQIWFLDEDDDDFAHNTYEVACERPGVDRKPESVVNSCTLFTEDFAFGENRQFDTELSLQANDYLGWGAISYLYTDTSGNHRLGGGSRGEDTAGSNAGAGFIWSVDTAGNFITGSVKQYDTELSLQTEDRFGRKGVTYLFADGSGNHRLGSAAHNEDTAGSNAGAGIIRAVNNSGNFVTGSVKQYDTELSLQANDQFGYGGISYLFTDGSGNHRLGGGTFGEDTAGADAGAGIIRAVNNNGNFVTGSVKQYDTEFSLQAGDYFGEGGITHLFTDSSGNHRLGGGAHYEGTAGGYAGAAIIRAVDDTGNLITGSVKQYDTELSLQASDYFGQGGIIYLFADTSGNHRLGGATHVETTAGGNAGAGIIRAVDDTGNFVSGSVKQYDTELSLQANDFFGQGGIRYLFTDNDGHHRLGGATHAESTAGGAAGAGIIRAVNNSGNFVTGSVKQYDTELGLQTMDNFGYGGISYLFEDTNGTHRLGGGARTEDTAATDAGAAIIRSVVSSGNIIACDNFDCDDTDDTFYPGAPETCDGRDNNCDLDITYPLALYRDVDEDGYGTHESVSQACSVPSGYVTNNRDCDDTDPDIYPRQVWFQDADEDGYSEGTHQVSCASPGSERNTVTTLTECSAQGSDVVLGEVRQYDTELSLQANDNLGYGGVSYLFTDTDGHHRLGGNTPYEDTAAADAGAAIIRSVDDNGNVVTGSVKQYDTELSLQASDYFGFGGISYLFTDTDGHHRLGGGAVYEDTAAADAGAVVTRSVDDDGNIVAGSVKQYDTELSLQTSDYFGYGGVSYLFTDTDGNHRLGAGAYGEDTAGLSAGAAIIRAIDDDGEVVGGSVKQYDTELSLEASDNFGFGLISHLFTDTDGNHRLGGGAYGEDTAGSNAGAAIIRAVNDDGELVTGSVKQYDTELSLQASDNFGFGAISYLFTDIGGNHRLGGGTHGEDTAATDAGAAIIRAVDDDGRLVAGSVKQYDTEFSLQASDNFARGGIFYFFTDTGGNHRLGGGASAEDTAGSNAGAAIIRSVDDSGDFIEGSVKQYDTEVSLEASDSFGYGGISYLFTDAGGDYRLGGSANAEDTAGSNAGAAIIRSVDVSLLTSCDTLDCDDTDGNNYPNNTESCDDRDNDCDEEIDEVLECRSVARKSSSGVTTAHTSAPDSNNDKGSDDTNNDEEEVDDEKTNENDNEKEEEQIERTTDDTKSDIHYTTPLFVDMPKNTVYADAITFLEENGVAGGIQPNNPEQTHFEPYRSITRGELYAMVVGLFYDAAIVVSGDENETQYAEFLKQEGVLPDYNKAQIDIAIDLTEVINVIVVIFKEQGLKVNEKKVPKMNLGRTLRRMDAAVILKRIMELIQE